MIARPAAHIVDFPVYVFVFEFVSRFPREIFCDAHSGADIDRHVKPQFLTCHA